MSADLNTDFPGMLHYLKKYGPVYLAKDEARACIDRHMSAYYEFLAKSALRGRGRDFWSFHKCRLAESKTEFSRLRLFSTIAMTLLSFALNPLNTMQKLLRNFKIESERTDGKYHAESADIAVAPEQHL